LGVAIRSINIAVCNNNLCLQDAWTILWILTIGGLGNSALLWGH